MDKGKVIEGDKVTSAKSEGESVSPATLMTSSAGPYLSGSD